MSKIERTPSTAIRFGKWAGLYAGAIAWFADQQINSVVAWTRCPVSIQALVIAVGAICAVTAAAGGYFSFYALRRLPDAAQASHSVKTDRFIALLSLLMACFSLLAVVFGTPAGLILRCER
jgi:nitrate reductase gamma subunit